MSFLFAFHSPFFAFTVGGKEKKTTPSLGEKARNTVEISSCPPEKGLPHLRGGLRGKRGQSVFPSNTVWDFIACKETIQVEWFVHFSSDFQSLISFVSPRKSCNLTTPFLFAASIPLFLVFAAGERKTTTVCGGTEQFATLSTFPWNVSFCYLQWKRVFKVSHKNSAENDSIRYKHYGNLFCFQLFIGARLIRNIFCAFKQSLWKLGLCCNVNMWLVKITEKVARSKAILGRNLVLGQGPCSMELGYSFYFHFKVCKVGNICCLSTHYCWKSVVKVANQSL